MSENKEKEQKQKNIVPKPVQRAIYAGVSAGGFSFVFGMPAEYIPRVALAGACYSFLTDWHRLGPNKRKRGRRALLNGKPIDLEYSMAQGGYMARETWGDTLNRWMFGKGEAKNIVKPSPFVPRPSELDDFTFISSGMQLREIHVELFLRSAWRLRQYGKGLSARRWDRNFNKRPAWYKELSTDWYYAMMKLLYDCQSDLSYQMIITRTNNWNSLANPPLMTIELLKWYECERRK